MLGFVYRTCKNFNDNSVMLCLYKSLVRSGLEYCSSIWSPSQEFLITKLERVQKKLVRWLCIRDRLDYSELGYEPLCVYYQLQTLESRRKISDLCNLNKICNNNINCNYLVSNVYLSVPIIRTNPARRRARSQSQPTRNRLFSAEARINVRKASFIPRVLALLQTTTKKSIFLNIANVYLKKE